MKMVKNLTLANIKKIEGLERAEKFDFHDDGSNFRGFIYKGIPMTTCRYESLTYLSIRIDNMENNFTYNGWTKVKEHNLCYKYNGVEDFDIDELIEDLNKIIVARNNLQEETTKILNNIDYKALKETIQKEIKEATKFVENFKSNFAWFNAGTYELTRAKEFLDSITHKILKTSRMDISKCQPRMILNMIDNLNQKGYAMISVESDYYCIELKKILEKY